MKKLNKNGIILPLVLVFLCILGVLVLAYNQSAMHSKQQAFRAEQEEIARRVLESALDETFYLFDLQSADSGNQMAQWLYESNSEGGSLSPTLEYDAGTLTRTKSIVEELNQSGVCDISCPQVQISKRYLDWRNYRQSGGTKIPYYGQEGQGTVIFKGTVKVSRGSKQILEFTLEKHHDFKVICVVSGKNKPGREIAQNRSLDYNLYVREGLAEFVETKGKMLNNSALKLEFQPHGMGKIYFGGTDGPSRYVFLNIPLDLVPPPENVTRTLNDAEIEALSKKIMSLEKDMSKKLEALIKQKDPMGVSGITPANAVQSLLKQTGVSLKSSHVPISSNPVDKEKYVHDALFDSLATTGRPYDNVEPGISLMGSNDEPHNIIEGHVRQRYIYMVESDGVTQLCRMMKENLDPTFDAPSFFVALTAGGYAKAAKKSGQKTNSMMTALHKYINSLSPPAPLKVSSSRVDDELPYRSKLETERGKQYAAPSVPTNYLPYGYANLRAYAPLNGEELAKLGFLRPGKLKIRCGIHVRAPFTLGESGPLEVEGQGVLSSNSNITIKAGITCPPNATLVLVSKGEVIIETSDKIEAGIVAGAIRVSPGNSLHLKGSLFVDRLRSENWPAGPHVVEYDSTRFCRESDLYSVAISPRATYVKLTGTGS